MKINSMTNNLISKLIMDITGQCHNPNSYNGYTGEYGSYFTYPVYYNKKGETQRTRYLLGNEINEENISSVVCRFGSNHLSVGDAVVAILNDLEKRYGIDFSILEEAYQETQEH